MDESRFFTVETEHTVYPVGMYKYAFPTEEAAGKFAYRAVLAPGIVHAKVLDSNGALVVEFGETKHKHDQSWVKSKTGYQNVPTCPNKDCPDC